MQITRAALREGACRVFTVALSGSIRCFRRPSPRAALAAASLRTWRAHGLAHTSAGPDSDRHVRLEKLTDEEYTAAAAKAAGGVFESRGR
jgi:hypothetical protein